MTKRNVAKSRARTKPRTEKPAIQSRRSVGRVEKPVDSEIQRAAKRAGLAERMAPSQEDVYRRLLRDLRRVTAEAIGADDYLCQTIAELEAVEELLEYREDGGTTAADASLAAVVHGVTARLDLAVKLRAGLWDPDDPHATVLADTKVLPMREGGAS
jgi:hypothetical protein